MRADFSKSRVFGRPVCEVIFWKDSELGAARGSAHDVLGGFGIVEIGLERLLMGGDVRADVAGVRRVDDRPQGRAG